jgi:CheY-like chemotaxis protein
MSGTSSQAALGHGSRRRILVVDDEPSICTVLVSVLASLGYEPIALADPRAALRMIETARPKLDLLITDFAMPHMSGLELIRRSKALQPELKTVLASGEVDQPEDTIEPRPDAYLEKPFSTRALAQLLGSLVGREPATPVAPSKEG